MISELRVSTRLLLPSDTQRVLAHIAIRYVKLPGT